MSTAKGHVRVGMSPVAWAAVGMGAAVLLVLVGVLIVVLSDGSDDTIESSPDSPTTSEDFDWPAGDAVARFGSEATWVVTDGKSKRWASDATYECLRDLGMREIDPPWELLDALPDGDGEYLCVDGGGDAFAWPAGDAVARFGSEATWVVTDGKSKRWASDATYECLRDLGMREIDPPWELLDALPDGDGEYLCVDGGGDAFAWPAGDAVARFGHQPARQTRHHHRLRRDTRHHHRARHPTTPTADRSHASPGPANTHRSHPTPNASTCHR